MATIRTNPGAGAQGAANMAAPGDTVVLADGPYSGGLLLNKSGVTVVAENPGGAILLASQVRLSGTNNVIRGVVVTNVNTNWDTGSVVAEGTGCRMEDVIIRDGGSIGLDIHGAQDFTALRVRCLHNGAMG